MSRSLGNFEASTVDVTETLAFGVTITNASDEKRTLDFEAYGAAPANALMTFARMNRVTREGKEAIDTREMAEFIEQALLPDSARVWAEMIAAGGEWNVEGSIIGDVFEAITERWSGRPTGPSSSSAGGRSPNGATSTVSRFTVPESTSSPSPSPGN